MTSVKIEKAWDEVGEKVLTNVKVQLLQRYVGEILHHFSPKIGQVVSRYTKHLPSHVANSELDDLSTIAKLEFLETLKIWNPIKNDNFWPLAQARLLGAMKDHIRYITKSDPTRFYDWMTDAAHVYMMSQEEAGFEKEIESGDELNRAMAALDYRERKIVLAHTKEDLTFKKIGLKLGISESQVSRLYKKSIEKIKEEIRKQSL